MTQVSVVQIIVPISTFLYKFRKHSPEILYRIDCRIAAGRLPLAFAAKSVKNEDQDLTSKNWSRPMGFMMYHFFVHACPLEFFMNLFIYLFYFSRVALSLIRALFFTEALQHSIQHKYT